MRFRKDMNTIEKRNYIQNHLYLADDNTINLFFNTLQKEEILKSKIHNRAIKSEEDIRLGNVYSRVEIEKRIIK